MLILQIKDTLEVKAKPGSFSLYTEFLVYSYLHPKTFVRDSLRCNLPGSIRTHNIGSGILWLSHFAQIPFRQAANLLVALTLAEP